MTEPTVETWLYAGQREVANHQLAYAWSPGEPRDEENLLLYKKLPGVGIGASYTVKVARPGGGGRTTTVQGEAVFDQDGERATDEQRAAWQSRHVLALRERQRYLAEQRLGRDNVLEHKLEPVLRLVHRARTHADKRAIVQAAYERLNVAIYEREE